MRKRSGLGRRTALTQAAAPRQTKARNVLSPDHERSSTRLQTLHSTLRRSPRGSTVRSVMGALHGRWPIHPCTRRKPDFSIYPPDISHFRARGPDPTIWHAETATIQTTPGTAATLLTSRSRKRTIRRESFRRCCVRILIRPSSVTAVRKIPPLWPASRATTRQTVSLSAREGLEDFIFRRLRSRGCSHDLWRLLPQ